MQKQTLCGIIALIGVIAFQSGCQSTGSLNDGSLAQSSDQAVEEIYEQFGKLPAIETIGLVVDNIYSISEEKWNVAKRDLQIGERLQVIDVLEISLAAKAGLEPGDRILQINGTYVPKTKDAAAFIATEIAPTLDHSQPISFLVIRGRTALELSTASS